MNRSIYNFSAEFRKIIANSIDMTKAMENTSNDLNDTAMNTKSSVGIVDRAMENMSDAANKQAAIVVDVNRDMSNLGNMIKNTYAEIKTINDYNMEILNSSRTANKIVSELTYIKESLNSVIDVINKQAGDTYDLTKTIRKYAEMIVSFADETNLLALNATIEAARVGEEGKGFAIVATQIQGLADQSTSVSNDITKAVNLLVDDSKKSLDTMNQVNSVIEKLNINIDSTKEIFNSVNEGIGYSADGLNKIQEQTAGIDKARSSMMKVMGDLQDVSEKNIKYATDTEEVTKHIGKLFDEIGNIKEMTENLVDSVKIFEV
jgi:methyl-accepting chemotaxis protein